MSDDHTIRTTAQFAAERLINTNRFTSDPFRSGLVGDVRNELIRFYEMGREDTKKKPVTGREKT